MSNPVAAATVPETVTLRTRPDPTAGETFCGDCWEPIAHDGSIWRHVRTGLPAQWNNKQCAPQCDWPDCHEDAISAKALGRDEWTGHDFRFRNTHFLCQAHWGSYRSQRGAIERT